MRIVGYKSLVSLLLSLLVLNPGPTVFAQSALPTLTPEQRRLLDSLPQNQREALIQRYLGSSSSPPRVANLVEQGQEDDMSTDALEAELADEEPRTTFTALDTVVLVTSFDEPPRPGSDIQIISEKLNAKNPFILDDSGRIHIPHLAPITFAGLTEQQAELRLSAEPDLAGITIQVFRLPVEDLTDPELSFFGYDFFSHSDRQSGRSGFQSVPRNYILGPGDTLLINFFGNTNGQYELQIDRDGVLMLPELGPVTAVGLSLEELRNEVKVRVEEQKIGTQVSVTLNELRAVRVFVVGEVENPGAYMVDPFSTITQVLTQAGRVSNRGSLRNIELKRSGRVVSRLDIYAMLLKGDVSKDRRIAFGDVIFVPPVGPRVSIMGEVQRPAIYEIRAGLGVSDALAIAGGMTSSGYGSKLRIERIDPQEGLSVIQVTDQSAMQLQGGDTLIVPGESKQLDNAIVLRGHVHRAGLKEWRYGMRLSDVLTGTRDLKPQADQNYVLIRRQQVPNGEVTVLSADLRSIWSRAPGGVDPELQPRDEIIVFNFDQDRGVYLDPILDTLKLQAASDAPMQVVRVTGEVRAPGEYPLEEGMTVGDLIRAGGGFAESAYSGGIELTRYVHNGAGQLEVEVIDVTSTEESGVPESTSLDLPLIPFDSVSVKRIPEWGLEKSITLTGEIVFPGTYSIKPNETLIEVIDRAGGVTASAFLAGSVFTRESLRAREKEQIDALKVRLEGDMAAMALSDPGQTNAVSLGRDLLSQLENAKPTGRLVIDLQAQMDGNAKGSVFVRNGDLLHVPKLSQEVTVIGEVQYPTSHLWEAQLTRDDYIVRSGGLTVNADRKRIYVVRASGEVVVSSRSQFFSRSSMIDVRPGDTVVVPLHTDRVAPLVLWTSATQILYNLAIAAAAANGF